MTSTTTATAAAAAAAAAPKETTTSLISEEVRSKVATIDRLLGKKGLAGIVVELGGQIGCGKTSLLRVLEQITGLKYAEETIIQSRVTSDYMRQYYEDGAPIERAIMVEVGHTLANTMEFYKQMSLIDRDLAPRLLFMDRGLHSVWTFTEMICDARRLKWMNEGVDQMREAWCEGDKDVIPHYKSPPPRADTVDALDDQESTLFRHQLHQLVQQQAAYLKERNYFSLPIFLHLKEEHCAARRASRVRQTQDRLRIAEEKLLSKEDFGAKFNEALQKHALTYYKAVLEVQPEKTPVYVLSDLLEVIIQNLLRMPNPQPTRLPASAIKKRKTTQTEKEEPTSAEMDAALAKAEWKMDEVMTRAYYTEPEPPKWAQHNVPLRPGEDDEPEVKNDAGEEETISFTTQEARDGYKNKMKHDDNNMVEIDLGDGEQPLKH